MKLFLWFLDCFHIITSSCFISACQVVIENRSNLTWLFGLRDRKILTTYNFFSSGQWRCKYTYFETWTTIPLSVACSSDYSSYERESIRIKFSLNLYSVANQIFRCGCCKLETKHIKLNCNARFIVQKAKLFYFYFFECDAAQYFNFIFVKTCDFG